MTSWAWFKARMGFTVRHDPTGAQGREAFDQVSDLLASKYRVDPQFTQPQVAEQTTPAQFYTCLSTPLCGLWVDFYHGGNKFWMVQLEGFSADAGMVTLAAEAEPELPRPRRGKPWRCGQPPAPH